MAETWVRTAPNRHPEGIAQQFADELFPGRAVDNFTGQWFGYNYRGQFQFVDGSRTYLITCDRWGRYTITILLPSEY